MAQTLARVDLDATAWRANRLTAAERDQFDRDGYLVVPDALPQHEFESCREALDELRQLRRAQGLPTNKSVLDPGQLFFDAESRAVQAGADHDENAAQVRALKLQQGMCDMINRLQTRKDPDHDLHSFGGQGWLHNQGKGSHIPHEVPPAIFAVPKVSL